MPFASGRGYRLGYREAVSFLPEEWDHYSTETGLRRIRYQARVNCSATPHSDDIGALRRKLPMPAMRRMERWPAHKSQETAIAATNGQERLENAARALSVTSRKSSATLTRSTARAPGDG